MIVALLQLIYISREGISFVYPFNDIYHFILNLGFASHWGFEYGHSFNAPVWSVSIEVLLYTIFFVTAFWGRGNLIFVLFISIFSIILFKFYGNIILQGISLFYLGGVVFHITQLVSRDYQFLKYFIWIFTATIWLTVIINFYVVDIANMLRTYGSYGKILLLIFTNYILFPITICCIALIEIERGEFLKRISWIGDITYSSYLLHFPLQLFFALLVSYNIISPDSYLNSGFFAIFFMILIPSSYVTYIKFERPVQKMIRDHLLTYR